MDIVHSEFTPQEEEELPNILNDPLGPLESLEGSCFDDPLAVGSDASAPMTTDPPTVPAVM